MVDLGKTLMALQRIGVVLFVACTVGYNITSALFLGFVGLGGATMTVAFSIKTSGWVSAARSLGTGLVELGLLALVLRLLRIRILFLSLTDSYWIALLGLILNVGLILFEEEPNASH